MPEQLLSNLEGPITITSSESITLQVGDNILEISEGGITLTVGDSVVEVSDAGVTVNGTTIELVGDSETSISTAALTITEG